MVDVNEDLILDITNIANNKNKNSPKLHLIKNSNNINGNKLLNENKNQRLKNLYLTDEIDLLRDTYNFKNNKYSNETTFPIKIKKMKKSDIIIHDEISKNNKILQRNKVLKKITKKKNEQSIQVYKCDKCNKTYTIKNSYQKHLLIHNGKKYICSICDAKFDDKSKLNRHLLIHSDTKEFKCNICDSAFKLKYNLKVHMRVHNNEKPYICGYPGCFAKFTQKNNLNTHYKIHKNNLIQEKDETKMLLNFYNNIIKFNNKNKNLISKLEDLNKMTLGE